MIAQKTPTNSSMALAGKIAAATAWPAWPTSKPIPDHHPDDLLLAMSQVLASTAVAFWDATDDSEREVLARRASEVAASMVDLSASTAEGVEAKVRAIAWQWIYRSPDLEAWGAEPDRRLAVSVLLDAISALGER